MTTVEALLWEQSQKQQDILSADSAEQVTGQASQII